MTVAAQLPEAPVVVDGWEPGLRLVVENLVRTRCATGGREVRVALAADGPAPDVEDDGPGVPEAERERIFAPFARVDGTDTPARASGWRWSPSRPATTAPASTSARAPELGGARFTVRFG